MMYSIKQMELLSGIKAPTIRMWEKRYNLFSPQRTDTNIRRYNDDDLRYIINVSLLIRRGFRISKIAYLSADEISELASKFISDNRAGKFNLEPLITATVELNEDGITEPIDNAVTKNGIEHTYENFISPFLIHIYELWQTGGINAAQEHFANNTIRNYLNILQLQIKKPAIGKKSPILFFLPEGECREVELLYFLIIAKNAGYSTIYLGPSTPVRYAMEVAKQLACKMVFTSLSSQLGLTVNKLMRHFCEFLPDNGPKVILAGDVFNGISLSKGYIKVGSTLDFHKMIASVDPTIVE